MLQQLIQIAKTFAQVAEEEDKKLSSISGRGIFFMPELAYAYACGKEVMSKSSQIFGDMRVEWLREETLGLNGPEENLRLGGPSDLVFKLEDGFRIVVEFKMRDKLPNYRRDIEKLKRLSSPKDARIFCALVDPCTDRLNDSRVEQTEKTSDCRMIRLLDPFPQFPTKQDRYQGEVSCVVAVWAVGEPPILKSLS